MGSTAIKLARIGLVQTQESDPLGLYHGIALTHLANNLRCYGAPEQAKNSRKLLERALQIMASNPEAAEKPQCLIVPSGSLAIVYGKLGMTTKEVELLEQTLTMIEDSYGLENHHAAVTLSALGKAYGVLGRTEERQKLLEQALRIQERIFGPDHLEAAKSMTSLGIHIDDLNRKQQLLERALSIMEREVGLYHHDTQVTVEHLVSTYGRLGNTQKQSELRARVA